MIDQITARIAGAKKYKAVYRPTIERIVRDCVKKYGDARAEAEARSILHQIWGSYYPTRPDFKKLWKNFEAEVVAGRREEATNMVLRLHASSRERLPIFDEFYKKIFSIILRQGSGQVLRQAPFGIAQGAQDKPAGPLSVVDHGCCLDPVAFGRIPSVIASLPVRQAGTRSNPVIQYQAFDIDTEEVEFLQKACELLGYGEVVKVAAGDAISDEPVPVDVVFMLKLLPVLEQQQKGSAKEVLLKQRCTWLVVSYPVASLSGKEKGMTDFYTGQFMDLVESFGWQVHRLLFATELVFVCRT